MARREPWSSICPTCNDVETCTRRAGFRQPVVFCEEFDDASSTVGDAQAIVASGQEENADTSMGLCCNCSNRNSCKLCGVPGGVWHCEEYV